jgi:SAM-dependent methyltransferase
MDSLLDKWNRIYSESEPGLTTAAEVLTENGFLLPPSGRALDLASGLGANAIFLARRGLAVTALDQSSVAIAKLNDYAAAHKLTIDARQQKIDSNSMSFLKSGYDVIVVSRFLDRTLSDAIIGALNLGGLLFYQTYTQEKLDGQGPGNPDYLLAENELLKLFSPLRVVFYRENALIGNSGQGLRNEAQFVGRK